MEYFPAPAKLNLFLHVVGRRADGYHLLQTVFRLIDFGDEVGISVRGDGVVRRINDIPGLTEESDLTMRAARLLKQRTATAAGADIELTKRLPFGGGVGGGSSDAATALIALNHRWEIGLSRTELMRLGAELGADVPFFIYGQTAFAEGTGDRFTPCAVTEAWYLVLAPAVAISSGEIFSAPELRRDTPAIAPAAYVSGWGGNDLQPIACARYPEVARHLEWLEKFAHARMTGSGACVFATFANEAEARAVFAQLPAGMKGFLAQGIDRHPMYAMADGE